MMSLFELYFHDLNEDVKKRQWETDRSGSANQYWLPGFKGGMMDRVIISIKKGAVIDVEAPSYIDVVVRDYDIDGVEKNLLDVDEEGELYREMVW
jgi:hypothetical protein